MLLYADPFPATVTMPPTRIKPDAARSKSDAVSRSNATRTGSPRVGSRLGKYRLERRIGSGGFANVYCATDTLLGIRAALKIPLANVLTQELVAEFRREARLTMRMEHPNILPIRDASFIGDHFVIVSPLADRTLNDRLKKRIGFEKTFDLLSQLIAAVSHAHQCGVIHCDIKPENVLLFDEDGGTRLRLGDFGIAKAAIKTISGSGTGTIGHMAPEQAMGKPSKRSDVFSIGLIAYRMLSGVWPEFPFDWPMDGCRTLRRKAHPELVSIIQRCIEMKPKDRFRDAEKLDAAWQAVRLKAHRFVQRRRAVV